MKKMLSINQMLSMSDLLVWGDGYASKSGWEILQIYKKIIKINDELEILGESNNYMEQKLKKEIQEIHNIKINSNEEVYGDEEFMENFNKCHEKVIKIMENISPKYVEVIMERW